MMGKDVAIVSCRLFFRSIRTRVPLKFGPEVTTHVLCARTKIQVAGAAGGRGGAGKNEAAGWGETPLSIAWVWPSSLSCEYRLSRLKDFCIQLAKAWNSCSYTGHPLETGRRFIDEELKSLWTAANRNCDEGGEMPWLAALVCNSLFDIALHDAYGIYHGASSWDTYTPGYMNHDLSWYYTEEYKTVFRGKYPADYLVPGGEIARYIRVWHLVGAKDALDDRELSGEEPEDGYPVKLADWILRDGLKCIKIKLTGIDAEWDYRRLAAAGRLGLAGGVQWLSADFNCTVKDPRYVCEILDRLMTDEADVYKAILYVEQPFPYDIEAYPVDVRPVSARKPLFMDESAHSWEFIRMGRALGWSGVALKTCKTISGALLSLCWAKQAGMTLMVQDLTNPMLAQIPHVELAAHAGTIMGVESNGMQFYPEASADEARVHPGLYRRENGFLDMGTLGKEGFGYRIDEILKAAERAGEKNKWEEA
jgi:L-alanine-DL-glutamate epimerase-like enolase superfamily enzyme